jgi:LacI family transcriptional regulator
MKNRASIRDVAEHAGVSIATVSHVINKTRNVSPATRNRVENSIKHLGYIPNSMARGFKTGSHKMIGCIIPDISNYFWAVIIEKIEEFLSSCGYHLIIINTKETAQKEIDGIKLLSSGMVDGLIIGSTLEDAQEIYEILPHGFPVVFIDRTPEHCFHDNVTISNYSSIYNAVVALIHHGHKKIGYIAGLKRLSTTKERLTAYNDAMSAYGLSVDDFFVQAGDSMYTSASLPFTRLLQQGCSAVVVSNNVMAAEVMSYLFRERNQFPTKIDVIGYQEGIRDMFLIQPLGLISQPAEQMGQWAAQQILTRIDYPESPIRNLTLSSTLTLYESDSI